MKISNRRVTMLVVVSGTRVPSAEGGGEQAGGRLHAGAGDDQSRAEDGEGQARPRAAQEERADGALAPEGARDGGEPAAHREAQRLHQVRRVTL